MNRLLFFTPPFSMTSGSDVFGPATTRALGTFGIQAVVRDLWPEWAARAMFRLRPQRLAGPLFDAFAGWTAARQTAMTTPGDVAWFVGFSNQADADARIESRLRARGVPYIFFVRDDWFSVPNLREGTIRRVRMADLVAVPNVALRERVRAHAPAAPIEIFEEPVDVDRLRPLADATPPLTPFLVWCGNPGQLPFVLPQLVPHLEAACRAVPFRLRIVCGHRHPSIALNVPWEWHPYDPHREAALLAGAAAGLAYVEDTPYTRCKGAFKIKTYMAVGVPPVASAVGLHNDLIEHGHNGLLIHRNEDWTATLIALLRDPDRARAMGDAARAACCARYGHAALIPAWGRCLRQHFPTLVRPPAAP